MPERTRRTRVRAAGLTRVSIERRRAFRWLLLPAAQWIAARGVGRRSADRVGAAVARAGVHARHLRGRGADRASARRAAPSRSPRARPRARRTVARARGAACARAADGSLHRRDPHRASVARVPARRARSQDGGAAAGVRAHAGGRVRPSAGDRPLSADAGRSADGAAAGRGRRHGADVCRRPSRRSAATTPHRDGAEAEPARVARRAASPSRSIPGMAARTRARSAGAARTRRTSCSRSRGSSKRVLDADPNMRVMLTRDDDFFVPLAERVQKARRVAGRPVRLDSRRCVSRAVGARLVGVRAVRARRDERRGALARAERERGRPDRRRQPRRAGPGARAHAARPVADRADQRQPEGRTAGAGRHRARTTRCTRAIVEQAGFAVLKAPDIPSILVETAFISNPDEELKLREPTASSSASPIRSPKASIAISRRVRRSRAHERRGMHGTADRHLPATLRLEWRRCVASCSSSSCCSRFSFGLELTPWAQAWFVTPWTDARRANLDRADARVRRERHDDAAT